MKIAKWGNSLAVRLPKAEIDKLGLKAGDDVEVAVTKVDDGEAAARAERMRWLIELRKYRGLMPADFKFDRDEANSRG